jgi:hypothetical protein
MERHLFRFLIVILSLAMAGHASAATVDFIGAVANDQGTIGYSAVHRSVTAPGATAYAGVGVEYIYTELASPDNFDYTSGGILPHGSNLPTHPFAATASAPHALGSAGLTGDLHIASSGFSLDYTNAADLYFSDATTEHRIYRGGSWTIFEETAPDTYNPVATYADLVATMTIDYLTGNIVGSFTGTRLTGSSLFPEMFTFIAYDPIDVAGTTTAGAYGQFSTNVSFEVDTSVVPEPATYLLFGMGLLGLLAFRRKVSGSV